jgi:hypothetical protein
METPTLEGGLRLALIFVTVGIPSPPFTQSCMTQDAMRCDAMLQTNNCDATMNKSARDETTSQQKSNFVLSDNRQREFADDSSDSFFPSLFLVGKIFFSTGAVG